MDAFKKLFGGKNPLTLTAENQEELALQCIGPKVKGGFDGFDEIFEAALEYLEIDLSASDRAWIEEEVTRQLKAKKSEVKSWPTETDWNRLDTAFQDLHEQQIVALHNAGYTMSDGLDDVTQAWQEDGGAQSTLVGYAFYHGQDLERVVESGNLYLAFGSLPKPDVGLEGIAASVVSTLKRHGLNAEPPADTKSRILVTGIDWKKPSP